jgi:hypothetical protein
VWCFHDKYIVVLLDVLVCIRVSIEKELMYIGIGWLHDLNAIVFYNESPTNNISCLVCWNAFYLSVYAISAMWILKTEVYKIGSYYSVRMTKKEKLVLCENSVNSIPLRS